MKKILALTSFCLFLSSCDFIEKFGEEKIKEFTAPFQVTDDTSSQDDNNQNSGPSCTGTNADGDGTGIFPIIDYDLKLAGQTSWVPNKVATQGKLLIDQFSKAAFTTNFKLKFRLKLMPQPMNCPYKEEGPVSYPYYTKARFTLKFHTLDASDNLNPAFHEISDIGPVDLNGCSQIFTMSNQGAAGDFPNPATAGPIFVSVHDVKSDYDCQTRPYHNDPSHPDYAYSCPSEVLVRTKSCWNLRLQVVNDYTDDFKN